MGMRRVGSLRFLNNIVRFPGCGTFDPGSSFVAVHKRARSINEPSVPIEFADVIRGIHGITGLMRPVPLYREAGSAVVTPNPAADAALPVGPFGPQDFYNFYNENALLSAGVDGSGQTVGIIAETDVHDTDLVTFRTQFGLAAKPLQRIVNGPNPGIVCPPNNCAEVEAILDTEWSGAVAPNATILLVITGSTPSAAGVYSSIQYAVNNNVAPILSASFGVCEEVFGSGNQFVEFYWQQAATQGQTVFVSTGDSGAAGCATGGNAINGIGSTPFNVAVGGTAATPAGRDSSGIVTGYGNEVVWDDLSGATGGGASIIYTKPAWQSGLGVPADGARDVPDIALQASPYTQGYWIAAADIGGFVPTGGTSASAPAMAGIYALINQMYGRQGNANPQIYALGRAQFGPSVTAGSTDAVARLAEQIPQNPAAK